MSATILDRLAVEDAVAALPLTPDEITLSVIVPTYRRPQELERLLAALEKPVTANARYSVVVVNDGSHDVAYQRVLDRYGYFIDSLALPQNCGPARARNEAVRRAKGNFLVFTDDDCEPPAHWLDRLAAILEASPFLVVVGGVTRHPDDRHKGVLARFLEHMQMLPRPLSQRGDLYDLPAANVAVRKDWFEAVGGFDPCFRYAAGEDTNLTFRLCDAGASTAVDKAWYTGHDSNATLKEMLARYYRYGFGNMQYACLSEDPTLQGLYLYDSLWEMLWQEWIASVLHDRRLRAVKPWSKRWLFAVLFYLTRICYQCGAMRARLEMGMDEPVSA